MAIAGTGKNNVFEPFFTAGVRPFATCRKPEARFFKTSAACRH